MLKRHRKVVANGFLIAGVLIFVLALIKSSDDQRLESRSGSDENTLYTPTTIEIPLNNPLTSEKVRLGRHLFYDKALSFNRKIACADCHQQNKAFTDGRRVSIGATGQTTRRNAMSLTNVAYNGVFTWADPSVGTLEQQALIPLTGTHPIEMGVAGNETTILARFRSQILYQSLFREAFPSVDSPVSLDRIVMALASFQRTLISQQSDYDRFMTGDKSALSALARRGMNLFFSSETNCFRCHGGNNFRFTLGHRRDETDQSVAFHNTGLYNVDGMGAYPETDRGLFEVSGRPQDMGKFKAPTLRNIALTAPYMHDGSIGTLQEVLAHYARGGRLVSSGTNAGDGRLNPYKSELVSGFDFSREDESALLAFLHSLTDQRFISNPELGAPTAHAAGAGSASKAF